MLTFTALICTEILFLLLNCSMLMYYSYNSNNNMLLSFIIILKRPNYKNILIMMLVLDSNFHFRVKYGVIIKEDVRRDLTAIYSRFLQGDLSVTVGTYSMMRALYHAG